MMLTQNRHLQEFYQERGNRRTMLFSGIALNAAALIYGVGGLLRRGGEMPAVGFLATGVALFFLVVGVFVCIRVNSDLETFHGENGGSGHNSELLALASMAVNGMLGLPALVAIVLLYGVFPLRGN